MKKIAIVLSVFPGCLFAIALVSLVVCAIAERNLPPAPGANIGLGLLALAALINIPTAIAWMVVLVQRLRAS